MAPSRTETGRRLIYATVLYWHPREIPLLARCVESLLDQECGAKFELRVIVVDNGCGVLPGLPGDSRLDLVHLAVNQGFTGGHNEGIRQAMARGADYVLLFNSDAVAEPGCVARLLAAAETHASAAFIGPLIVRSSAPDNVESAGQSFSTATGRHREIARGQSASSVGACARVVDAVSGCALLARTSVLGALGLLDERLFIYFEDMDWCLRARRAGYSVVLAPTARVQHLGSGSTGPASPFTTYLSVRNHMVVAGRYGGRLPKGAALVYHLGYVIRSPERRTKQHFVALARGARDAWTGRVGAPRPGEAAKG